MQYLGIEFLRQIDISCKQDAGGTSAESTCELYALRHPTMNGVRNDYQTTITSLPVQYREVDDKAT